MNNLATNYERQGRLEGAEKLKLQVLKISTKVLGKDDHHTLKSMGNLASTYEYAMQGRFDEAEKPETSVAEMAVTRLGPEHPDALTARNTLVHTLKGQGRDKEAIEMMTEAAGSGRKCRAQGIQTQCVPRGIWTRGAQRFEPRGSTSHLGLLPEAY